MKYAKKVEMNYGGQHITKVAGNLSRKYTRKLARN